MSSCRLALFIFRGQPAETLSSSRVSSQLAAKAASVSSSVRSHVRSASRSVQLKACKFHRSRSSSLGATVSLGYTRCVRRVSAHDSKIAAVASCETRFGFGYRFTRRYDDAFAVLALRGIHCTTTLYGLHSTVTLAPAPRPPAEPQARATTHLH